MNSSSGVGLCERQTADLGASTREDRGIVERRRKPARFDEALPDYHISDEHGAEAARYQLSETFFLEIAPFSSK